MPSALNDERTVELAQQGDAGDAVTLFAGGVAQATLDTLPFLRALDKIGGQVTGEAVKNTADRFAKRFAKEVGTQALLEGSTELAQEAIKNTSHAIVTGNPELLYNDQALKNYIVSFATGAVLGGALGGGIEAGGAAGRQAQRTARQTWESTKSFFANRLRAKAGPMPSPDPAVQQNQSQADSVVSGTRTPQDPAKVAKARERYSAGADNARLSAEIEVKSEELARDFNAWNRSDNTRFSLDGFSDAIVRASGGPEGAVNLRMLSFVDGIDPLVQQLRSTGGDAAAADFLARGGSGLYRQFSAPQTLSPQDAELVAQLNQYISPTRREMMESLASEWQRRQSSIDAVTASEEAEAGTLGAADEAGFAEVRAAMGMERTTQDYEGDLREDNEAPAGEAADPDSRFAEMAPEVRVRPVEAFISQLRAPNPGVDIEALRAEAIADLEGPIKSGNKWPNNVIAESNRADFYNRRRQENGVLPYGEGKVWDATGRALQLLAQNRAEYANAEQPAKAALLDALSQAAAVGMPVDFSALRPGVYRLRDDRVTLTAQDLENLSRGTQRIGPNQTGRRPTAAPTAGDPQSVVPYVDLDLGRENENFNDDTPKPVVVKTRRDGTVVTRTERGDTRDQAPAPPDNNEADYRRGPGPLPAGSEARPVYPVNRTEVPRPRPPVYNEDGEIVEHGWVPADGGGFKATDTGQIIRTADEFRKASIDARGTVPDMSPLRGVTFPNVRAQAVLSPESQAAVDLGRAIGADFDQDIELPVITRVIDRVVEASRPDMMRAVVQFRRNGKKAEVELEIPSLLRGWSIDQHNKVADDEASRRAQEIASSGRVKADFLPTVPDEVRYDKELVSADAKAILARLFSGRDALVVKMGVPRELEGFNVRRELPRGRSEMEAYVNYVAMRAQGQGSPTYAQRRAAEQFMSELRGLADLAGPTHVLSKVLEGYTPEGVRVMRPVVAQRGERPAEADADKLGRYAATKATDAELAAVKEAAANRAPDPFNASRLNVAQARVIQQYAAQLARKLNIPHVLTRFGGFLRRDGQVRKGATTISIGGKHFIAIHTANMRAPDEVLDAGKDELARMRRTVAHEMAHVLDRLHHDATGSRLTDDPEFRRGSALWAEVEAAAAADPVLAKAFGYILRDTDPDRAARELFSQLVATRESHPEKMNEHLAYGARFASRAIRVAAESAAGGAEGTVGSPSQAAAGEAGAADVGAEGSVGADGRNQPEPEAAGGRGRQRNSVLKDEGTMGPSGPLPAGAMESARVDQPLSQPANERYSADPGVESVVSAPAGQHDLAAEGAYVQGVIRGMGFGPTSVTVTDNSGDFASLPPTAGGMRVNPDGTVTIALGRDLVGLERLEVLQHEIGHVALFQHIAKTAGVELKSLLNADGSMPSTKELVAKLAETDPELHAALEADYKAWLSQNANKARGVNTMLGSRGGVARAAGRRARGTQGGAGPALRDMDQATVNELMSMEEWIADGVVRALNRNGTGRSLTEKFFDGLATALRAAYDKFRAAVDAFLGRQTSREEAMPQDAVDAVRGTVRGNNPPAPPSIQKWVDGMFTAEAKRLGPTVSAGRREILLRAADFLHRARHGLAPDPETIGREAPAQTYAHTVASLVKPWAQVMRYALTPEQRGILWRVLSRDDVTEKLSSFITEERGFDPAVREALYDADIGPELRIAMAFSMATQGSAPFGPNFNNAFNDAMETVSGWLGYASDADYAQAIMNAVQSGELNTVLVANRDGAETRAEFDHVKAHTDALRAAGKADAARKVERNERFFKTRFGQWVTKTREYYGRVVSQSIYDRAVDSGSTNIRRIVTALYKPGDVPGADAGLIRAAEHKIALESQKAIRALGSLSDAQRAEALGILQRATPASQIASATKDPEVAKAVEAIKAQLAEFDRYARQAGMQYGYQRDFFPVVMDVDNANAEAELGSLLSEPNLEPGVREFYDRLARKRYEEASPEERKARNLQPRDPRSTAELIEDMVQGAKREADFASSYDGEPRARGARHRSMDFIYKLGTPEQIARFAKLQSQDIATIMGSYIEPMTRLAEYERRFGGGRLERMLERAREEGASDDDIQMARAAVAAAMGTYGKGEAGSPVISLVSESMAKKLAGRGTQRVISNVMAYQNVRLLPLALLSSLTDPLLITLRNGGDLGNTLSGIRNGLRATFTKEGRAEMERMIEQIGAAADFGAEANLVYALGGMDQAPTARAVNDFLFRWNGMTGLAKATRYMALHSAHGFLARHALRPNEHSARYFRELGLREGDVQVETVLGVNGKGVERVVLKTGNAERDARVRQALVRFVDDAVLRPNPIQSPLWHADPYMGLVTQYKGFLYAMWDQMGRRMQTELGNGNLVGPFIALLAYAPLAVMAMLMREEVQYLGQGNPARAGWDAADYTAAALNNSGLLGPSAAFFTSIENDLSTDRLPLLSQLGPSFGQAQNVASSAVGERSGSETFQEAIPTQVIWEKWIGTEPNRQPTEQVDPEATEPEMGLRE